MVMVSALFLALALLAVRQASPMSVPFVWNPPSPPCSTASTPASFLKDLSCEGHYTTLVVESGRAIGLAYHLNRLAKDYEALAGRDLPPSLARGVLQEEKLREMLGGTLSGIDRASVIVAVNYRQDTVHMRASEIGPPKEKTNVNVVLDAGGIDR